MLNKYLHLNETEITDPTTVVIRTARYVMFFQLPVDVKKHRRQPYKELNRITILNLRFNEWKFYLHRTPKIKK